jgi:hypothetical protein
VSPPVEVLRPNTCVHCGRNCNNFEGGSASFNGFSLCHPNEAGRPDCYHMVSTYRHELYDCERCTQEPYRPLTPSELHDAMIDSLRRVEQMVRDAMP